MGVKAGLYDRLVTQPYERGAPHADRLEGCMLPAPGVAAAPRRLTTGCTAASSSLSSVMTTGSSSSSSSSSIPRPEPLAGADLLPRIAEKGVGVVVRVAVLCVDICVCWMEGDRVRKLRASETSSGPLPTCRCFRLRK